MGGCSSLVLHNTSYDDHGRFIRKKENRNLELHSVGKVSALERKLAREVLVQVSDLGDGGHEGSIHVLLQGLLLLGQGSLGLLSLEEFLTGLFGLFGLGLGEVRVLATVPSSHAGDVNGGAGGDHVGLVHAAKRNVVDLEGTADEQESRLQLLKEHNALAFEAASQEDQHSSGGDRLAQLGGFVVVLASFYFFL